MTGVQRQILLWVADNGGRLLLFAGYKTTRKGKRATTGEPCIVTSMIVIEALTRRGWLKHIDPDPRMGGWYELTDAGREAVAPKGKWPLRKIGGRVL